MRLHVSGDSMTKEAKLTFLKKIKKEAKLVDYQIILLKLIYDNIVLALWSPKE